MTVFFVGCPAEAGGGPPSRVGSRIGFTVSKALGGAVQRNRMRRRLREAVRLTDFPSGVDADIVINPKRSLLTADFAEIRNEVAKAFVAIEKSLTKEKARN